MIKKNNNDSWDTGGVEVQPSEMEPKRCSACGDIFIPKWFKEGRCGFCRRMKIPYKGESSDLKTKPF